MEENRAYRVGVLGAGTWGTALARMLDRSGKQVIMWSALPAEVRQLTKTRRHPNLPDMIIPDDIRITGSIEEACMGAELLLFAVPSPFVRQTAAAASPFIRKDMVIADAAKGIEPQTLLTMTCVIADELKQHDPERKVRLVALSGPTHAEEVAQDLPTTIVSASLDREAAELAQDVFMNTCMRVYTNEDVLGVELCGALKNIIALASGIACGLGFGDNAKAAIITRGLAEIRRLGMRMGCREQTFSGLAGVGDLIVTATSRHSRNNRAGELIGRGASAEEAKKEVGMVVEGINALPAAMELSRRLNVEMPITFAVNDVISGRKTAKLAVRDLMERDRRDENAGGYHLSSESALLDGRI